MEIFKRFSKSVELCGHIMKISSMYLFSSDG